MEPIVENPFAASTANVTTATSGTASNPSPASTANNTPVRVRQKEFKPRTPRNTGLSPASPNPCVVLKNLDYKITQGELEEVVRRVAGGRKEFVNLSLIDDRTTGQFRGMAFVNFHNVDDAANALAALGKMSINNRKVVAEYRRMRPGEKVFLPAHSPPASKSRGVSRTTFERDVKTNGLDEHGKQIDIRKAFFSVRDNVKKADISREKLEKQQRDTEREAAFRKRLIDFNADAEQTEDIQFENDLTSYERRMVHLICDEIGLGHMSVLGDDGIRVLKVTKHPDRIKEWAELTVDIRKAANERKDEEKKRRKEEREAAKLAAMNIAPQVLNNPNNGNNSHGNNGHGIGNGNGNGFGNGTPSKREKAEREGIKWFKPRSAKVADGETIDDSNTIKVPTVQVYVPARQPLGPDGTIGFHRRKPKNPSEEENGNNDDGEDGADSKDAKIAATAAAKKKNGFKASAAQTPLNPSVQPFTPSATYAT